MELLLGILMIVYFGLGIYFMVEKHSNKEDRDA